MNFTMSLAARRIQSNAKAIWLLKYHTIRIVNSSCPTIGTNQSKIGWSHINLAVALTALWNHFHLRYRTTRTVMIAMIAMTIKPTGPVIATQAAEAAPATASNAGASMVARAVAASAIAVLNAAMRVRMNAGISFSYMAVAVALIHSQRNLKDSPNLLIARANSPALSARNDSPSRFMAICRFVYAAKVPLAFRNAFPMKISWSTPAAVIASVAFLAANAAPL